jgi:Glycosyl hydrolase family 26
LKTSSPAPSPEERLPIGLYDPGALSSWDSVAEFGRQAGQPVRYVLAYLGPDDEFPWQFALEAAGHGAEPVLQLEPTMPMARIAAGDDDEYLARLADAIRDYGYPVTVSFAAEANGNWYQYGWTQTPASEYRAAWAQVMRVMRNATNITWMDTINRDYEGAGPIADYVIPGVDRYGIDAYYVSPDDTFDTVIVPTLRQIRAVTDKPVMINETGIGQVNDQEKSIPCLVSGAREHHLAALVYFNSDQGTDDPYHQDWALTPAALAVLRKSLE